MWMQRMWNRCSFTKSVSRADLDEYLLMVTEYGGYMPCRTDHTPTAALTLRYGHRSYF